MQLYKQTNFTLQSYINRQTSLFMQLYKQTNFTLQSQVWSVRAYNLQISWNFPCFVFVGSSVSAFSVFCNISKKSKKPIIITPKDLFRCNNKANDKRLGTLLYCLYCYIRVGVCYLKGIAQYFKNMNHNCSCYGCGYSHMDNVILPQMLFKYFASKNQLPGFFISGTLVENGLMQ